MVVSGPSPPIARRRHKGGDSIAREDGRNRPYVFVKTGVNALTSSRAGAVNALMIKSGAGPGSIPKARPFLEEAPRRPCGRQTQPPGGANSISSQGECRHFRPVQDALDDPHFLRFAGRSALVGEVFARPADHPHPQSLIGQRVFALFGDVVPVRMFAARTLEPEVEHI